MNAKRVQPSKTHDKMISDWMKAHAFHDEYDRFDEEFTLLDKLLAARKEAGLTQKQVAERIGTK